MTFGKLCIGHTTNLIGYDTPRDRILDIGNRALDVCVNVGAILKGTVTSRVKGAVHKRDVIHVAQGLFSTDVATYQLDMLAMPGKIFSIKFGIIHCHVVALPETVLGRDLGMMNLYVFTILEDIFGIGSQAIDIHILAEHKWVGTLMKGDILDFQSVNAPKRLIGIIDGHVFQFEVVHLTEELGTINHTVAHDHIVAVPYGRAALRGKVATGDKAAVNVPPGILAIEFAVAALQIVATLDARLTIGDRYILQQRIVRSEERTLTSKTQIVYSVHVFLDKGLCICCNDYKDTKIIPNKEKSDSCTEDFHQ